MFTHWISSRGCGLENSLRISQWRRKPPHMPKFGTKRGIRPKYWVLTLGLLAVGALPSASLSASLLVDYKAVNYNPNTGVWADSSGNANNATTPNGASSPTLLANATPNGSSAVNFAIGAQSEYLGITTGLAAGSGYTVLAFAEPTEATYFENVIGGPTGAMTYRTQPTNGVNYQVLGNNLTTFGTSITGVPTSAFSMIGVATDNTGNATFYFNGNTDGTTTGSDAFTAPINLIGTAPAAGLFTGNIAELQIYSGVLSTSQVQAVNQTFINLYVNPVPEPTGLVLLAGAGAALLRLRRKSAV